MSPTASRSLPLLSRTAALLLVASLTATLAAQRGRLPEVSPYTKGEPERMQKAGILSYGPFPFAGKTTSDVAAAMISTQYIWIEVAHHRIGLDLPPYTVPTGESPRIREELTELAKVLPTVNPKAKILDPWLRLHLYAHRAEKFYLKFQELLGVTDASFPGERPNNYMGEGPFLGEKGKFEVLITDRVDNHAYFVRTFYGAPQKYGKLHNFPELDTLCLAFPTRGTPNLTGRDPQVHNSMVHLLTHLYFDAYRHYSYDVLPAWKEGLAHYLRWNNDPEYPYFMLDEAAAEIDIHTDKWKVEARKLALAGEALPFSKMLTIHAYGDLDAKAHLSLFSKVDFLIEGFPDGKERFRKFMNLVKGRLNPDTTGDGSDMTGCFRDAIQQAYGLNALNFDEQWKEWVLATYPAR
jgi:hypothetical protein